MQLCDPFAPQLELVECEPKPDTKQQAFLAFAAALRELGAITVTCGEITATFAAPPRAMTVVNKPGTLIPERPDRIREPGDADGAPVAPPDLSTRDGRDAARKMILAKLGMIDGE